MRAPTTFLIALMGCALLAFRISAGVIVVDPGHGGPGADMYHNGGGHNQNRGAVGPDEGVAEQWVNLEVAMALLGMLGESNCILTRYNDTADVSYRRRIGLADSLNCDLFLSIHHNGLPLGVQGTEMRWCGDSLDSDGLPRQNDFADSTFAKKALYKLLDVWEETNRYFNRCCTLDQSDPIGNGCQDCSDSIWIIKNVNRQHVLTEASNLNDYDEEDLFLSSGEHAEEEATALYAAQQSWIWGQGFGRIVYQYLDGNPLPSDIDYCTVYVDFWPYIVPYERCWGLGEEHTLEAPYMFEADGYWFTFHHWAEIWYGQGIVLAEFTDNPLYVYTSVAHDGYHYYAAYFTGGDFYVTLMDPDSQVTEIEQGDTITIRWDASQGVEQTCSLYIDLSTNGGNTWSPLAGPLPYDHNYGARNIGTYDWLVPDVSSDNCYLRFIAYDVAENYDTLISHRFGIDCYEPTAKFYANEYSGDIPLPVQFYDQSTHDPTGWYWTFGDGGTSYNKNPAHTYDSAGVYTVSLTATNQCGSDDTVMVDLINVSCNIVADFTANPTSGIAPLQVIFYDNSDPAYAGDYYLWDFGDGDTSHQQYTAGHGYTSPGEFSVSLTVGLPCGGIDDTTKVDFIDVTCPDGTYGTEWSRYYYFDDGYGAEAIQQTPDGGYVIAGNGSECLYHLWKINGCGDLLWDKPCSAQGLTKLQGSEHIASNDSGRAPLHIFPAMIQTADEGFAILGDSTPGIALVKTDASGERVWTRYYDARHGYSVQQTADGGYIIGASIRQPPDYNYDIYLIKTYSSGIEEWTKRIGGSLDEAISWLDVKQTSDGGYIAVSNVCIDGNWLTSDFYIVKTDKDGEIIWDTTYGGPGPDDPCTVVETPEGDFVIAGTSRPSPGDDSDFRLIKISSEGVLVWERTYGGAAFDALYAMQQTTDLGFIIAGVTTSFGVNGQDYYVVKTDFMGQERWHQTYDGIEDEYLHACIQTADGGYILGGFSMDWDNPWDDHAAYVVKIAPDSLISCCNHDGKRGDVDMLGSINVGDVAYLVAYLFGEPQGPEPPCFEEGDVDAGGSINVGDVSHLVDHLFGDPPGPPPAPCP